MIVLLKLLVFEKLDFEHFRFQIFRNFRNFVFRLPYLAVCILAAFGMFHLKAKVLRINLIPNMLIWDNRKLDLQKFEVEVGVNENWILNISDVRF